MHRHEVNSNSLVAERIWMALERKQTGWWKPLCETLSSFEETSDLAALASPKTGQRNPSDKDLQRAQGSGRIVVSGSERGTRITDILQRSPIRIMFPRVGSAAVEEAVLINTAGGVAGGDCLEYAVTTLANASITVTSQAAEKVYRALNEPADIATKLKAHAGGRLAWLPQETIVFNGGRICRDTEIEVASGAELLALEWIVLGRAARGEEVAGGHIIDRWHVKKDDRLIWADCFRVTDGVFPRLRARALLSNCKAMATLIYFGFDPQTRLEFFRDMTPSPGCYCAATSVSGLVIARFASEASGDLRVALRSFLQQFRQEFGPGPVRVPKMWSC